MIVTIGIFVEFLLLTALMGFFIVYAKTKAKIAALNAVKRQVDAQDLIRKAKWYSSVWHGLGLTIRLVFIGIVFFSQWGSWYHAILDTLISIILSWVIFDRGINVVLFWKNNLKKNFWYVDKRNINKFLGKAYWIITIALIIVTIYWAFSGQRLLDLIQ